MPFLQYKNGLTLSPLTVDPDQLPIFLVPGIMGNGRELYELAEALDKQRDHKTPIFIYDESELADDSLLQLSLDELADKMLQEIIEITNDAKFDIQLAGYSSGAIIGSILSRKLCENGLEPHLVVIDQPDMTSVAQYINQDSHSLMQDLINVVNAAARLSGLSEIKFTEKQVDVARNYLELEARFNQLADTLLRAQQEITEQQRNTFADYLARAKRNLNYPDDKVTPSKISSTHLILTKETAVKYGASEESWKEYQGGWAKRSNQLVTHRSDLLDDKSHLELLTGDCAVEIARIVSESLRQDPEKLFNKYIDVLQKSFAEQKRRNKTDSAPTPSIHQNPVLTTSMIRTSGTLFSQFNTGDHTKRHSNAPEPKNPVKIESAESPKSNVCAV